MPLNFEARLDGPEGKVIGKGTITPATGKPGALAYAVATLHISAPTDGAMHRVFFLYKAAEPISGGIASLTFNAK